MDGVEVPSSPAGGSKASPGLAPAAAASAARRVGRTVGALLVCLVGFPAVATAFPESSWAWAVVVALLAGAIAGRVSRAWIVWLAVAATFALAGLGAGAPVEPAWVVPAVAAAALLSVAFVAGTAIGWRRDPWATARTSWREMGSSRRWLAVGAVAAVLVGVVGYMGYAAVAGSSAFLDPPRSTVCDTPATRFGWEYEAINYDKANDARLVAENPDLGTCSSQGTRAGPEVVAPDGVPIAGWYIPAANGAGPVGPTVLIVHGGKANKSDVLKYAPPFHAAYNLVLVDLRNSGRSGPADSTAGLHEQADLRAMIDWLVRAKDPAWIGVVGNSNGAATAVAEADDDPRVRALVLDSMHATLAAQVGNVLETENDQPAWPGTWAILAAVSLRVGTDITTVDPVRTIARVGDRPVLLTHGSADTIDRPAESVEPNLHAAVAAGVPVGIQICQGATHGEVVDTCPDDWARWAVTFMDGARGS